jgi:hypothetical protein
LDFIVVTGSPRTGVGVVASWLAAALPGATLVREPGVAAVAAEGAPALEASDWDGRSPVVAAQVMAEGTAGDVLAAIAGDSGAVTAVVYTVRNPLAAVTSLLRRPPGDVEIDVGDKTVIERYCGDYRAGLDIDGNYAVPDRIARVDFDRLHDAAYRSTVRAIVSAVSGLGVGSDLLYARPAPAAPVPPGSRNLVHRFIGKDGWARWDELRGLAAEQAGIEAPDASEWSAYRPQDAPDAPTADDR